MSPAYRQQLREELRTDRMVRLGVITAQFGLVVAAVRLSNLESNAFELLATVSLAAFLVHHFLPAEWRLAFFAGLSVASVPMVLGWDAGLWLLGVGGLLIALCHLPVLYGIRVALIVALALGLAVDRIGGLPFSAVSLPQAVWPILGSMFMFRLITYLYDLRHGAAPFGISRALSYFFLLPNTCFPLFPVIDYKAMQRSCYNEDALKLYQTGINWMVRGLVHLALYKLIYFKGVIEPTEAVDGLGAARYMIATYLLYLKISGLFHLVVGLLHMFGFGLAETHHLYLFSSSFTDFWRRINIYWKDFIQKLVFNPAYFALRRLGETWALSLATLVAFLATWLFHSYQWFWIRGEFPIVWADLVFWLGLGIVVLVNVLVEARKGRRRSLEREPSSLRQIALHSLKIAGTFSVICVLWTIWSTPNGEELRLIGHALLAAGPLEVAVLLGMPLTIGVAGALFGGRKREVAGASTRAPKAFWPQAAAASAIALAFIVVGRNPALLLPVSPELATLARDVSARRLNAADSKKLQRGYYEDLGDVSRFNTELGTLYGTWNRSPAGSAQSRERADAVGVEYIPSTAEPVMSVVRSINSHGLRDREYALARPQGTYRIALVGASHDAGLGVRDDQTYENLVEDRLNRELARLTGMRFEVLNFSHDGYNPVQKLAVIERKLLAFQPHVVLYAANSQELNWTFGSLEHLIKNGLIAEYPFLETTLRRAGIDLHRPLPQKMVLEGKLAPFAEEALGAILERFRDEAALRGSRAALLLVEIPDDAPWREPIFDRLARLGKSARLPVVDLQGSFAGVADRTSLHIAPGNTHSNPQAHRLLADRLYAALIDQGLVPTALPQVPAAGR